MAKHRQYRRGTKQPTRRTILITALIVVAALGVYRVAFHKPQPSVDTDAINTLTQDNRPADPIIITPEPIAPDEPEPQPAPPPPEPDKPATPSETAAPAQSAEAQRLLEQGLAALAQEDFLKARQSLSQAVRLGLEPQQDARARQALNEAADSWLFSRNVYDGEQLCMAYKVVRGDRLVQIGKRFAVPYELLMRINNIEKAENLAAGETIKVVQGPFNAVVDRGRFLMSVYLKDVLVRSYKVGLGAPGRQTPTGLWQVKIKQPNPAWPDRETGRVYKPNDPDNPLGEHWIGLEGLEGDAKDRVGFGIHGTIKPEEIGRAASRACIRLHNGKVAELYDMVAPGASQVRVIE